MDIIISNGHETIWRPREQKQTFYTLDQTWLTQCPYCKGMGAFHIAAVTAGEPQPEEWLPCPLCNGDGEVAESTAALYAAEELDGVRAARRRAFISDKSQYLAQENAVQIAAPF